MSGSADESLRSSVGFEATFEAFNTCMDLALAILQLAATARLEDAFSGARSLWSGARNLVGISDISWGALESVGDESAWVGKLRTVVAASSPRWKALLPRAIWNVLCDRIAS